MCVQRKVFVTRKVPQPGIELLEGAGCNVELWDSDEAIPREELIRGISGAHALFCMLTDTIDGKVLDAAGPNLQVVATMSVGYEHIDLEACRARNIRVCNTPNVSTDSVAELTVALLLLTARRLLEGVQAVKDGQWGKWKPMWLCGMELAQKTVGILGLGRIGFGVARRLKPFGVKKIVYHDVCRVGYADDIGASFVEFDKLLIESDVICICCNLTPQTKQRFNKSAFKKMKRHAILVNSGRGGVIKHDDLLEALTSGEIAAAGLDVTEPEPLPADHPLVHQPNCIVLPHMGSNTWDSRNSMSETTANNILSVFNDQTATGLVQ
ncbi:glyoxylate reductase/hydroxypyruvate reductase-like isoform X1 [Mercenaria mercenaria]|uniref:glyoxylate reductase/hydroxypyruvate reductase-like isoform X1 n=1 Tax=Mercenaria mercenaria TaxID=6596 RepID=UPI00234ED62F|nr:glyoxylate reductase/hydroxypyruvate reductase-like isoform X1 [Mercenaria mercenaria]